VSKDKRPYSKRKNSRNQKRNSSSKKLSFSGYSLVLPILFVGFLVFLFYPSIKNFSNSNSSAEISKENNAESQSSGSSSFASPYEYLKKIGNNHWVSPEGLHYKGKDPKGLDRVAHVLRHAINIPYRPVHSVFIGGKVQTLRVVDEAWAKIKSQQMSGKKQGSKKVYLVNMDRKVGYLGGKKGKHNKKPLSYVKIITAKGAPNVITAYPQ